VGAFIHAHHGVVREADADPGPGLGLHNILHEQGKAHAHPDFRAGPDNNRSPLDLGDTANGVCGPGLSCQEGHGQDYHYRAGCLDYGGFHHLDALCAFRRLVALPSKRPR
jgi:hypothetical protein